MDAVAAESAAGGALRQADGRGRMRAFPKHFLCVILALVLGGTRLNPCTVVCVEVNGLLLVGNNEDGSPDFWTKVWFRVREEGRFGYMSFGFADGFVQGGMNEQGLTVAWVAGYASDWKTSSERLDYPGNLSQKILMECSTVDEAISVYERFNQPDFLYARTMLADRSGRSAILLWDEGAIRILPRRGRYQVLGIGVPVVESRMRKGPPPTVDGLMSVMTGSAQKGEATTLFSVVYDLRKGEATVFNIWRRPSNLFERIFGSRRSREAVVLNLGQELRKGNHFYDIPFLQDQLDQPPRLDGPTLRAVEISSAELAPYEGRFRGESGMVAAFRVGRSHLLLEWPRNRTVKTIALRPFSESRFFAEYRDLQVEFLKERSGQINSVLFHWKEENGRSRKEPATRISESTAGYGIGLGPIFRDLSFGLSAGNVLEGKGAATSGRRPLSGGSSREEH